METRKYPAKKQLSQLISIGLYALLLAMLACVMIDKYHHPGLFGFPIDLLSQFLLVLIIIPQMLSKLISRYEVNDTGIYIVKALRSRIEIPVSCISRVVVCSRKELLEGAETGKAVPGDPLYKNLSTSFMDIGLYGNLVPCFINFTTGGDTAVLLYRDDYPPIAVTPVDVDGFVRDVIQVASVNIEELDLSTRPELIPFTPLRYDRIFCKVSNMLALAMILIFAAIMIFFSSRVPTHFALCNTPDRWESKASNFIPYAVYIVLTYGFAAIIRSYFVKKAGLSRYEQITSSIQKNLVLGSFFESIVLVFLFLILVSQGATAIGYPNTCVIVIIAFALVIGALPIIAAFTVNSSNISIEDI